ncbi:MAG: ABC transporter ATP-binding protein [Chloroflexota bacterium]
MSRNGSDIALRCRGVTKRFDDAPAVEDFTLEVKQGQILALVGPSGCGKTTALRLIAGLERLDSGTIEISGRVVAADGVHVNPNKRRVGIVFQDYALFPHLNVADNVGYGLGRKSKGERVAEVLELVGLRGMENRLPSELSGGQQQRVALARTLAAEPDVILLDEPFSNLDAGLRERVRAEIRDILKRTGTTTVFVTHDQQEALFMGDLVGVQMDGKLQQVAEPETVFHQPVTKFVAQFMGAAVFLPVSQIENRLVTPAGPARALPGFQTPQDGSLEVMARPDDVVIVPNKEGQGTIVDRVFQGWSYMYTVELDSGHRVLCQMSHLLSIDVGTRVLVSLRRDHPLLFFKDGVALPQMAEHDHRKPATPNRARQKQAAAQHQ